MTNREKARGHRVAEVLVERPAGGRGLLSPSSPNLALVELSLTNAFYELLEIAKSRSP